MTPAEELELLELEEAEYQYQKKKRAAAGRPKQVEAQEPDGTAAEAALQGVGQGLSFGFLPWLQSKAEALGSGENPFGDKAEIYRQQWAKRGENLAAENPNISLASEVAGGMLLPIGAAGTGAKAAAKMGAALGGLSGLGRSASSGSGIGGTAQNVLTDAAFGGLAGGVMGKLGSKLAGSRPSEAVTRAAAAAPGMADSLRETARHHAARAALRPYFTDSKELVEQAAREISDQTEIPVEKAFSEAGEYLIQNKMVPTWLSDAKGTAKQLGQRSTAAGQLMGSALNQGDEFLQAWGIPGVPLSTVTEELAGKAATMRSQLGKSNQTAALDSALGNVEGVANFDRPRTLRELQTGATSAYGDVKFAKPDLSKEPKLAEAVAYKNAIRNVLGGMSEPGFREKLSQATYPPPRQGGGLGVRQVNEAAMALPEGAEGSLARQGAPVSGAKLLPENAAPEARWNDVSNLLNQYNIGAEEFGINRGLQNIASKGEQRRWALRMLTPKASFGAGAGGILGGLAGGPLGAVVGAGAGGLAVRGIQAAADPLTVRASLAGEKALRAFPGYAPALGSGLETAAQGMGEQLTRAGQFSGGALSQYFGMNDQPVQSSSPEQAREDYLMQTGKRRGQP